MAAKTEKKNSRWVRVLKTTYTKLKAERDELEEENARLRRYLVDRERRAPDIHGRYACAMALVQAVRDHDVCAVGKHRDKQWQEALDALKTIQKTDLPPLKFAELEGA